MSEKFQVGDKILIGDLVGWENGDESFIVVGYGSPGNNPDYAKIVPFDKKDYNWKDKGGNIGYTPVINTDLKVIGRNGELLSEKPSVDRKTELIKEAMKLLRGFTKHSFGEMCLKWQTKAEKELEGEQDE